MSIPTAVVLGWKFNHAPGICTLNGVVTSFPNPCTDRDGIIRNNATLPSVAEINQWTTDYNTWLATVTIPPSYEQRLANLEANINALAAKTGTAVIANAPVVNIS